MPKPEIRQSDIEKLDSDNMFDIIKKFPFQIRQAVEIGRNAHSFKKLKSKKFLILGMGGSAIGGSLLETFVNNLGDSSGVSVQVNRNYDIPDYIGEDYNVIASSYSGGTEETISAFRQATNKTKNIICITTGGELGKLAGAEGIPIVEIPTGFQPRCALGFSFFPMLFILKNSGVFSDETSRNIEDSIDELIPLLENMSQGFSDYNNPRNEAVGIASRIYGKIPIFYSSEKTIGAVNTRWQGQIQENAKLPAFGSFLPEMNHNEINMWTVNESGIGGNFLKRFIAILLRSPLDSGRINARTDVLKSIIEDSGADAISLTAKGQSHLAQLFYLIYFADWVSFYLAIMNNISPTPIPLINKLKNSLKEY